MDPCNGFTRTLILFICICTVSNRIEADIQLPRRGFFDQVLNARQKLEHVLYPRSSGKIEMDINFSLETTYLFPRPNDIDNIATGLINIESVEDYTIAVYRTSIDVLEIWKIKQTKLFKIGTVDLSFLQYPITTIPKSFEWNGQLFLVICFPDKCSVFTVASDSTVMFRVSVSSSPGIPIDAHFFVQSQNLFILVLYQTDQRTSHTRIYQWDKTSLDEVKTPHMVSSATSVVLFMQNNNLVIVMQSTGESNIEYPSQVWLRRASGETYRVQNLPTHKPESISHFTQRGEHFIIVLQQNQDKSIYWWTGDEFVRWRVKFEGLLKTTQVFTLNNLGGSGSSHQNQTFLVFKTSTTLDICVMAADHIQKVSELPLPEGYLVSAVTMEVANENIYLLIKSDNRSYSTLVIYKVKYSYNEDSAPDELDRISRVDYLQTRLDGISLSITELKENLTELNLILPTLLYTNKPVTLDSTNVTVSGITHIESGEIWNLTNKNFEIAEKMQSVLQRIPLIQNEVTRSWQKLQDISETRIRELDFKGKVHLKAANINSLAATLINKDVFKPESYLYSTPPGNKQQRLKELKAKEVEVTWLVASHFGNSSMNSSVKDFMIQNSVIEVPIQVVNLTANNVEMKKEASINYTPVGDLLEKKNISVFGKEGHNYRKQGHLKKEKLSLHLQDNTVIDNLNVEEIDGIPIVQLFTSLFVQNTKNRNTVYGNVHFKRGFHAKTLSYSKPIGVYENQDTLYDYSIPNVIDSYEVSRKKREDSKERKNITHHRKVKVLGDLKVDRLVVKNSSISLRKKRQVASSNSDQILQSNNNLKAKNIVVRHLIVDYINDEDVRNLLSMSDLVDKDLHITTQELTVRGNLDSSLINTIDVNEKFKQAVFVDEDFHLKQAFFESVSANNIKVDNLQEIITERVLHFGNENGQVNFTGSLHFPNVLNVGMINDENVDFDKVVNKHIPTIIHGRKRFSAQVSIQYNMSVATINNRSVEDLSNNVLRTSTDQELQGFVSFRTANISSLSDVREINGIDTSRLLYTNEHQLNFSKSIKFSSTSIEGNITANSLFDNCQLPKVVEDRIKFGDKRVWKTLVVEGDSFWPYTKFGRLQMLLDSAVTNSSDQDISGNIYISQLWTSRLTAQYINGENITFIYQDSLMKSKGKQVISGRKTFKDSFNCQNLTVKGDTTLGSIVGINQSIVDIDRKLIRHTDQENTSKQIVTGHKTFVKGFTAFRLRSAGGINNIKADHIVRSYTEEDTVLPPLVVKSLHVTDNLQVGKINDLNLNSFLRDCIYVNSTHTQKLTKQLHIDGNLILEGRTTTPKINDVFINDLVFLKNERKSVWIKGCKRFTKNIFVETDIQVDKMNGKHFYETYESSIKKHQNVTLNGNLEILSDVDINTIFAEEYFAGDKKLVHISNKTASP